MSRKSGRGSQMDAGITWTDTKQHLRSQLVCQNQINSDRLLKLCSDFGNYTGNSSPPVQIQHSSNTEQPSRNDLVPVVLPSLAIPVASLFALNILNPPTNTIPPCINPNRLSQHAFAPNEVPEVAIATPSTWFSLRLHAQRPVLQDPAVSTHSVSIPAVDSQGTRRRDVVAWWVLILVPRFWVPLALLVFFLVGKRRICGVACVCVCRGCHVFGGEVDRELLEAGGRACCCCGEVLAYCVEHDDKWFEVCGILECLMLIWIYF